MSKIDKTKVLLTALLLGTTIVGGVGASAILDTALVKKGAEIISKEEYALSIVTDTKYDFLINNVTQEDVDKYTNDASTTKVVKYYKMITDLTIKGVKKEMNIFATETIDELAYTDFTNERCYSSVELSSKDVIYIDYAFSVENKLRLNDTITRGEKTYVISKIFKQHDKELVCIPYFLDYVQTKPNFQGCYVTCSDKDTFKTKYVNDLNPRTYFDKRANEKTLRNNLASAKKNYSVNAMLLVLISSLVSFVAYVAVLLALVFNKTIEKERVKNGGVFPRRLFLFSAIGIYSSLIVSYLIEAAIKVATASHHITFLSILSSTWFYGFIPLGLMGVSILVSLLVIKGQKAK